MTREKLPPPPIYIKRGSSMLPVIGIELLEDRLVFTFFDDGHKFAYSVLYEYYR